MLAGVTSFDMVGLLEGVSRRGKLAGARAYRRAPTRLSKRIRQFFWGVAMNVAFLQLGRVCQRSEIT